MPVINNTEIQKFDFPGIVHQTLASRKQGVEMMEVWMQSIQPGAETPVHRHDCEEVVVVVRGSGRVTIDGEDSDFGPNSTLILPPYSVHQIANTGDEEMFLIAAFGPTPVGVFTGEGERLALPWQAN